MYFEETDLTEENVLMILFCAKKYMVVGLEQLCRQFLAEHLNNANVCYLLDQVMCFLIRQNDIRIRISRKTQAVWVKQNFEFVFAGSTTRGYTVARKMSENN